MLTIRPEQLEVFRQQRDHAFVDRLIEHLRQHHTGTVLGIADEVLRQRVTFGIERARTYGLTWESSIGGFVALQFIIAPRFDEQRGIHRILTDPSKPPDERIGGLSELIGADDWFEASTDAPLSHWPEEV